MRFQYGAVLSLFAFSAQGENVKRCHVFDSDYNLAMGSSLLPRIASSRRKVTNEINLKISNFSLIQYSEKIFHLKNGILGEVCTVHGITDFVHAKIGA